MKKCKACKKEIDAKASKCPHCQTDQRNWFRKHPILSGILVLMVIGMFAGSGGSKEESKQTSNARSQTEEPKVATKISATELADEFDANQVAAEAKWKDQFVEFSAEITNITDSGLSFSKVATKDFSLAQISCKIKDKNQLLSLKNGELVTVRGIVGTQTIGVIDVRNCEVVE